MPNLLRKAPDLIRQLNVVIGDTEQKDDDLNLKARIAQFENQQTIAELKTCLSSSSQELEMEQQLVTILSNRWDRIRDSFMSYTQSPFNPVNRFCLQVAQELSPLPEGEGAVDQLDERKGPYFLLMPSLMHSKDVLGSNIHLLDLHQFILSDNGRVYIPLKTCLEYASDSDAFRHVVSENSRDYPLLSPKEMRILFDHSFSLAGYIDAVTDYHASKKNKEHLDGRLTILTAALRAGGAHAGGEEYNAGSAANHGILEFAEYWAGVSLEQQQGYYSQYAGLEEAIGRLLRPNDANYRDANYCVEVIANNLDRIIARMIADRPLLQDYEGNLRQAKERFEKQLSSFNYPMLASTGKMPHVLAKIYKQLNAAQQQELFKESNCSDAWIYALIEAPEQLSGFKDILNAKMIEQAASLRLYGGGTPLMFAINQGCYDAVSMLLELCPETIQERDRCGNTALLYAAEKGHLPILTFLLAKGANIRSRNNLGWNAFHHLRENRHPQLLLPLLSKVASLGLDQQAEMLNDNGRNPHDNVWTFTMINHPDLIPALLNQMIEENNVHVLQVRHRLPDQRPMILNATTLMVAVMRGNVDLLRLVLDRLPQVLGCNAVTLLQETDRFDDTALSWAAFEGKADMVDLLLDTGAMINTRGNAGNTALYWAARKGHRAALLSLLQRGADLTSRNNAGNNALDVADAQLIAPLLARAATLNAQEQREVLSRLTGGRYTNVLDYVLQAKLSLWDELRQDPVFPISEEFRAITRETLVRVSSVQRDFNAMLDDLMLKYQDLLDREEALAAQVALQLHTDLKREGDRYFKEPTVSNFRTFKANCNLAFDASRPVLEAHRGYTYYFANFALFFVGCGLIYLINKAITGNFFFFPPTEAVKKMNDIHEFIDQWGGEIHPEVLLEQP